MLLPAISIRQPWAFLITQDIMPPQRKDIENRTWRLPRKYIDTPVLVHAGKARRALTLDDVLARHRVYLPSTEAFTLDGLPVGGIVGVVRFGECMESPPFGFLPSGWAEKHSPFWWTITAARKLPFHPCEGRLWFFKADYPYAEALEGF